MKCKSSFESRLTLVEVFGGDGEHGVLDVLVLVHFGLVVGLVEIGRIVVLIGDSDTNELRHWKQHSIKINEKPFKGSTLSHSTPLLKKNLMNEFRSVWARNEALFGVNETGLIGAARCLYLYQKEKWQKPSVSVLVSERR